MGCCLSSNNKRPKKHQNHHFQESQNRAPPPTVEEETVKEVVVLSETPISKPHHQENDQKNQNQVQPNTVDNKENNSHMAKIQEKFKEESFLYQEDKTPTEISQSQASEVYSVSESFSVSTQTTVQENKHKEDEAISSNNSAQVSVKRVNRSPARKRPLSGEFVSVRERLAKSPARRADPSPEKRRAMRQSRIGQKQLQQRNVGCSSRGGVRRDAASDALGRRSRSPATRGGTRKVRSNNKEDVSVESCEKKDEVNVKEDNVQQQKKQELQQEGNESIENPHVSLECFIFL